MSSKYKFGEDRHIHFVTFTVVHWSGDKKNGEVQYQFWQTGNHTVKIWSDEVFHQKLNYIHENPVVSGFVAKTEDWLYSSAKNYARLSSVLEIMFDC